MLETLPPATRQQRFVFDEVAELYARVRPSYPLALIEAWAEEPGAFDLVFAAQSFHWIEYGSVVTWAKRVR